MIKFGLLGRMGNLGNQLFQIASSMGLAESYGHQLVLPGWQYSKFFKSEHPYGVLNGAIPVEEKHYHFHKWDLDPDKNYDIKGWLQSEKYWNKEKILSHFTFREDFKKQVRKRYEKAFDRPVIAISVRRGDYVGNPNYELLPASYYYLALIEHFPDFEERSVIFFSDDLPWCKIHFEGLPNVYFAEGLDGISQLCLMSQCQDFIIANSTFSWWGAYLADRGKVIRPAYLFNGPLLQKNLDKDFWPERWTQFDHKNKKIDLKDFTFTIPVHYDHSDRKQNVELSVCMLQRDFDTNIIIGEQGGDKFKYMKQWARYERFDYPEFHRTKMLNQMALMSETVFIVNYDADVLIPAIQIYLMAKRLRSGDDMVYPYDGRFARVPRHWFYKLEKTLDIGIFQNTQFTGKNGKPVPVSSVGGAVAFNKEAFIEGGMENEYMISYAPEDCERWDRFHMLGYKVSRIDGSLYHIDHWCGPNSSSRNPRFKENHAELDKIRKMTPGKLRRYIETWQWVHNYNERYYRKISQGALQSAETAYRKLKEHGFKLDSIIDIGCGIGEWKYGENYIGVDYRVPKKSLLIPEENYVDYDLTSGDKFPLKKKFDLCVCLEVLEHIDFIHAENAVKLLCGLSDTVLFSAAIPRQGGVGHINEQWQTYWADLFEKNGYGALDLNFRSRCYDMEVWYRQNIVIYQKGAKGTVTDYIDPEMWMNVTSALVQ